MIYDCFLFYNELDLLEIRLNELKDVVDKFVLVECSTTFSSLEKPFYFEENIERYNDFLDQIVHVKVYDTPNFPSKAGRGKTFHNRHDIEAYQRNCISRGLEDCLPDDIILLSDVDEIPDPNCVLECVDLVSSGNVSFKQKFFYYYLNGLCVKSGNPVYWSGTTACLYSNFYGAEKLRKSRGSTPNVLMNSGWHFSYLGGSDSIALKIESFAHAEWDNDYIKNRSRLDAAIEAGTDIFGRDDKPKQTYISLDDSFPKTLMENIHKYTHLIKEV